MKIIETIKKFSILPQGLRYKLLIAFSLMSIIPLLVIGYLVNNFLLLEETPSLTQISLIVLFSIIIAWLGLFLAKGIIDRVIDVALESRIITDGNYDRKVSIDTADEVGQIGEAINFLTKKIKDNIADLREYQDKMKEINIDIQRKVTVLSNLLQIGELISASVNMDSIFELTLRKLSQLYDTGFAALYFSDVKEKALALRASSNLENNELRSAKIEDGKDLLGTVISKKKYVVIDASSRLASREHQNFKTKYKCENTVAFPILPSADVRAVLLVGNNMKNFTYTNDDIEMIKVFSEQISIAIENDILIKKAEKLEIRDDVTGAFNRSYIVNRLKEEIERSIVSQRPCAFILIDIDDFKEYEEKRGRPQAEVALKKIAQFINKLSRPLGKLGRVDDDVFGLVMPESNKKEAMDIADEVRRGIEKLELSAQKDDTLTVCCGVSENPLDGSNADEIIKKAEEACGKAKEKGKNKVIGSGV